VIVYLTLAAAGVVFVIYSVCRRMGDRSADYPTPAPRSHVEHHPGPYDQHKEGT